MGRRYGDVVHVRQEQGAAGAPSAFVWHERLYVVREVLGHWHEMTDWWESPAARAVHGGDVDAAPAAGVQEEVWRVAASIGPRAQLGTYDLGRPGATDGWRLVQVVD